MTCNFDKGVTSAWWFTLLMVFISSGIGTLTFNGIYNYFTNGDPIKYIDHGTVTLINDNGKMKSHIIVVKNDSNNDAVISKVKVNNKEFPDFYSSNTITDVKLREHSIDPVTALICPTKKYCEIAVPYEAEVITHISFFNGEEWVGWE